jgi:hypothetical protein
MTKSSDISSCFAGEVILGLASINCLRNASVSISALLLRVLSNLLLIRSICVVFNTERVAIGHAEICFVAFRERFCAKLFLLVHHLCTSPLSKNGFDALCAHQQLPLYGFNAGLSMLWPY